MDKKFIDFLHKIEDGQNTRMVRAIMEAFTLCANPDAMGVGASRMDELIEEFNLRGAMKSKPLQMVRSFTQRNAPLFTEYVDNDDDFSPTTVNIIDKDDSGGDIDEFALIFEDDTINTPDEDHVEDIGLTVEDIGIFTSIF